MDNLTDAKSTLADEFNNSSVDLVLLFENFYRRDFYSDQCLQDSGGLVT